MTPPAKPRVYLTELNMKDILRVGFVLLSGEMAPIPSTRIAVLNLFPYLRKSNIEPIIIFQPSIPTEKPDVAGLHDHIVAKGLNTVVFQKVHGTSVEALVMELRKSGIHSVYCVCDLVEVGMATVTDATIVVTEYLKGLYPASLREKISVIHDGIEHPEFKKSEVNRNTGSRSNPLKAVLVTSSGLDCLPKILQLPEWLNLTIIGRYPSRKQWFQRVQEARWNILRKQTLKKKWECLRFYTNAQIHTKPWDPEAVYEDMCTADIGIIPIDSDPYDAQNASWRVKSENRLTMKMAIGLPVVASPIPSYEPVIVQGRNGFLVNSRSEWTKSLSALRDPLLREEIGTEARKSVLHRFSIERQAELFVKVLRELAR